MKRLANFYSKITGRGGMRTLCQGRTLSTCHVYQDRRDDAGVKPCLPVLLIFLAILTSCASLPKPDKWSNGDIYREVAFQTLNFMDYASTDKILGDHPRALEANPLLGSHPSRNILIGVAAGTGIAHAYVTHIIPASWRPYWQWPFILLKAGIVGNNYHIDFVLSTF